MIPRRLQNWPTLMNEFQAQAQEKQMIWGTWDCALMAAGHIDALTGSQIGAQHAGKYDSAETAAAYLATLGVEDLTGLATQILGPPLAATGKAQRGDIVTFKTRDEGTALGIMGYAYFCALDPSGKGLTRLSPTLITAAWRV